MDASTKVLNRVLVGRHHHRRFVVGNLALRLRIDTEHVQVLPNGLLIMEANVNELDGSYRLTRTIRSSKFHSSLAEIGT